MIWNSWTKYILLIGFSAWIVAVDQITKLYVHLNFQLGDSVPIIFNYFHITYVRNFGAAFGFLSDSHPAFRDFFFLAMPPVALVIILLIVRGVPKNDKAQVLALSSIFGGALGNYIDRIRFQYVIDFLDFHWQQKYTWPAFNVADMAIVMGVIFLMILMIRENQKNPIKGANRAS